MGTGAWQGKDENARFSMKSTEKRTYTASSAPMLLCGLYSALGCGQLRRREQTSTFMVSHGVRPERRYMAPLTTRAVIGRMYSSFGMSMCCLPDAGERELKASFKRDGGSGPSRGLVAPSHGDIVRCARTPRPYWCAGVR
jgi:hypothetical protein